MSRIRVAAYATDRPGASTVVLRVPADLIRMPAPRDPVGGERRVAARTTWQVSTDGRIEPVHEGSALARPMSQALAVGPRPPAVVVTLPLRRRRWALSGLSAAVVAIGIIVTVVGGRPATAAGESVAAPVSAVPTTDPYAADPYGTDPYGTDPYGADPFAAVPLPGAYEVPLLADPYAAAAYPTYAAQPLPLPPVRIQNLPTMPSEATLLPLPSPSPTTPPQATITTAPVPTTTVLPTTSPPPPTPALAFLTGGLPVPLRPVPSGADGLPVALAEVGLGRWTPAAGTQQPEVLIVGTGHPLTATVRNGGTVPVDTLLTVELSDRTPRYYTLAAPVAVPRAGFPALLTDPDGPALLLLVEQADGALVMFGALPYPPAPSTGG